MPRNQSTKNRGRRPKTGKNSARGRMRNAPTKSRGPSVALSLKETLPVFPISKLVTQQLYYQDQIELKGAGGVLARYVFSANGAYDPDITGTGHQMMGFDQMMLFYEQAVVVNSRIKVHFASGTNTDQRCAISLTPDTAAAASTTEIIENGLTVTTRVTGTGGTGTFWSNKTLELECDVAKYFGRTRKQLIAGDEFYCTAAANPTEQVYFQIQTWNPSGAIATDVLMDVILSFDIYYYEPRRVAASQWHQFLRESREPQPSASAPPRVARIVTRGNRS